MTTPSDREVFLNEVREDTHDLAQAATDAMVRRMGPLF